MTRLRFHVAMGLLVAPMVASCGPYLPLEGVVVDSGTDKPIPHAFVISQWTVQGGDLVGSRTGCPKVDVVRADAQGRYRFSGGVTTTLFGDERIVFAYKAGYEPEPSKASDPRIVPMKPSPGMAARRADALLTYASLRDCGAAMDAVRILMPLYAAIDQELGELQHQGLTGLVGGSYVRSLRQLEEANESKRKFAEEQEKARR